MPPARSLPALTPPSARRPMQTDAVTRRIAAAMLSLAASGCASVAVVDPVRDDGSTGFATACVGVLAAQKAATDRAGGVFTVDGHRALNEWMFQASRRSSLIDDEVGRAAERRRWAETLTNDGRTRRVGVCIKEAGV